MEAAISLLMAALDGANLIHDVGYLGQGTIGSPATIVMCAEIISHVKRILRGFDMEPDSIGLDVIREVGPGGDFLTTDQTLQLHKKEHWRPLLANRDNPERWEDKGSKTYGEIATQKAIEILSTHEPESLSDDVRKMLESIGQKAEEVLSNKHFEA
jgi:trimethylamine--corrinoid protein Co-methyltransferase